MTSLRPALLGAALLLAACSTGPVKPGVAVIDPWSPAAVSAARRMMALYGSPDDAAPDRLTWFSKGPWLRIVVRDRPGVFSTPRDFDLVVQTVRYPVTREQAFDIVAFSDALVVDVDHGEISSGASREEVNFVNLNLVDEVARGRKSAEEAKVAYRRILALTAAGKSTPYASGLRFPGR